MKQDKKAIFGYTLLVLAIIIIAYNTQLSISFTAGPNYRNVTIDTRVNITNARPEIMSINVDQNIVLTAGSTKTVYCNVSVRDWNNYTDINTTTAELFHSTSSYGAADDNNTHYTNNNCGVSGQAGNFKNFTCTFDVLYYAEPGTWNCSVFVNDTYGFNDTGFNTTTVQQVLALNVTPLIDYGDMAVDSYSNNETANVTNIGNVPINISVKGYGATEGDGLSFVCQVGNITIDNEKWSTSPADNYLAKTALSNNFANMSLTVDKQTVPNTLMINTTYWELYVPPNPYGECNGSIVFQAESS